MLEARIVAARIQGLAFGVHWALLLVEPIVIPSPGSLGNVMNAF
jgi:tetrahydromethanopterin S-methyltransferase subunit F